MRLWAEYHAGNHPHGGEQREHGTDRGRGLPHGSCPDEFHPPASSVQPAATTATTSAPRLSDPSTTKKIRPAAIATVTAKGRSKPSAAERGNITTYKHNLHCEQCREPGSLEGFAHRTHVFKPTACNGPRTFSPSLCAAFNCSQPDSNSLDRADGGRYGYRSAPLTQRQSMAGSGQVRSSTFEW